MLLYFSLDNILQHLFHGNFKYRTSFKINIFAYLTVQRNETECSMTDVSLIAITAFLRIKTDERKTIAQNSIKLLWRKMFLQLANIKICRKKFQFALSSNSYSCSDTQKTCAVHFYPSKQLLTILCQKYVWI